MLNSDQIRWCALVTRRSPRHTVIDVVGICDALSWAHHSMSAMEDLSILNIANLMSVGTRDYRGFDVQGCPDGQTVKPMIKQLIQGWNAGRLSPAQFAWEFKAICPFSEEITDWTAHVLYNWCNRTTGSPLMIPVYGT